MRCTTVALLAVAFMVVQAARAAVPGAPTAVVAIPGNARATIHLTPPASDGGFPITGYTVTSSPGGHTQGGAAWPIVLTGLTNGTAYSFTVTAANASGTGPISAASNTVTPVLPTITPAVDSESSFGLALDASGQVYAWGSDHVGQLGQGRQLQQTTPLQVAGLPPIAHISLQEHALAVDTNGQVWSWGENCLGALGPRANAVNSRPERVIGVTGVMQAAAGNCRSYALKTNGTVWVWGGPSAVPTQVAGLAGIVEITSGGRHVLARKSDNTVWAAGENFQGELGQGTTTASQVGVQVPLPAPATAIASSQSGSGALLSTGEIYVWGRYIATLPQSNSPIAVTGLGGNAIAFQSGLFGVTAVRADGTVWRYTNNITTPAQVAGMSDVAKVEYAGGRQTTFAISTTGALTATGQNFVGQLGQGHTGIVAGVVPVPGFGSGTLQVLMLGTGSAVLALKSDGTVWFWGENTAGQRGDGLFIGSSSPLAVPIPATIKAIATGTQTALALDTTGQVWGWGANGIGSINPDNVNRSTPTLIAGLSGVEAISAGGAGRAVYRMTNGDVWVSGEGIACCPGNRFPRQVTGVANIIGVAASLNTGFFLRNDGVVLALGNFNGSGELGDGTTTPRSTVGPVLGISGVVSKVVASDLRMLALTNDGRVYTWGSGGPNTTDLTGGTRMAVLVPGITDAVDIASSKHGGLARRANGSVVAWGNFTALADQPTPVVPDQPFPVAFHESVTGFALAERQGYFIGATGLLWGWGLSADTQIVGTVGDGTYVRRTRPVVINTHAGNGSLDGNNWYLDLSPGSAETIPPGSIPKALATSRLFGSTEGLGFDGNVKYKANDYGKAVSNYVVALVPPAFFNEVKAAPGASDPEARRAKAAKNGGFVLVQLTPAGWADVNGQLIAYSQGTANAAGGASNILNGINAANIPGSRFCVGYGESAQSMLSAGALREVLLVEGAAATASGVPCVLSGVYVSGPSTSVQSSPVTFVASVVGISPGGTVAFTDGHAGTYSPLGGSIGVSAASDAVATAAITTSALAVGSHSIAATYSGDGQNPPAASDIPKLHRVSAPLVQTQVTLEAPSGSSAGSEVTLTANVVGRSPTGTVQFMDGAIALGTVPVLEGSATLRTAALSTGTHLITAAYSGDGQNSAGTSPARPLFVLELLATSVSLSSSANPAAFDTPVTLTATVAGAGAPPPGTVTLHDAGIPLVSAILSGGTAQFVLGALAGGLHRFTVDYGGGGGNSPASSPALFQEVAAPPATLAITLTKEGAGAGTLGSNPAGLDCGATCTSQFLTGSSVTLTATASAGSVFVGWGGACAGSGACTLAMSAARNASARFELAGTGVGVAPSPLAFGGQSINTTSPAQAATVTNTSGAAIDVSAVVLPAGFGATHDCANVANGASCTVTVTFTPVAQGVIAANVALQYQQGGPRTTVVPVTGTGEKSLVTHYYRSILRRAPDSGGKTYWEGEATRVANLGANVNEAWFAMAQAFYFSAEYGAFNRDNTGYVTDLYNTFFNRAPDAGGLGFWVGQLNSGLPREVALASFMFSTEFANFTQAIFGNTGARAEVNTVVDFYRGLLARTPDDGGFNFWVGKFRTAQCQNAAAVTSEVEAISSAYTLSAEYGARARNNSQYVGDLYNAFLRRGGDLQGVQFWINQVASGAQTREQVRVQFRNSPEFQARVAAIIAQGCVQ